MNPTRAQRRHPERHARLSPVPDQRDVFVAYCRPDDVAGQFADNLLDIALYDSITDQRIVQRASIASGPRVAAARNELTMRFMHSDATYMWMVDADMGMRQDVLHRMLAEMSAADVTILGALAFAGGRTAYLRPVIYAEEPPGQFKLVKHYPENALVKVAATGAACLLIHRKAVEAVYRANSAKAHVWFADAQEGRNDYGEDITFCRRARAAGHDVYVHTGIQIGHMKTMPLHAGLFKVLERLNPAERAEYEASFNEAMGMK